MSGGSASGSLQAGRMIAGRYELERRIAVGGMGEVWEATDERLGRNVAVKVLRSELSDDDEFLHRFRIEARTVASLNHSGIAAIHDYGEDEPTSDGRRTAYLVMELVRGEPLSAVIARGPMEPTETLRIMEQAAHSLYAAHERGFVHRDVKPGNILIRVDGTVKLTDFGIAKAANAVPVTRTGMVMGTAHYIAPEQASGGEAGPEGDVYSLGIVGYECLAGHRPFRAENAVAVAMMQVRDAPPPLPEAVPWRVRQLVEAILVKDPDRRYADGAELAAAVAAVRRDQDLPVPVRLAAQGLALPPPPAGAARADGRTDTPTGHRRRSRKERRAAEAAGSSGAPTRGASRSGASRGGGSPSAGAPAVETGTAAGGTPGGGRPGSSRPAGEPGQGSGGEGRSRKQGTETRQPDTDGRGTGTDTRSGGSSPGGPDTRNPDNRNPDPDNRGRGGDPRGPAPRGPVAPTPSPPAGSTPAPGRPVRPALPPALPTEPLRLVAKKGPDRGRTALLVAFVLLILAAIVVAALTVPKLFADPAGPAPAPATGAVANAHYGPGSPGSVSGQVAPLARPAVGALSDDGPDATEEVR